MAKNKSYSAPQAQSFTEVIESFPFANLIDERYMNYTFHVMEDRAIPDARDGMKPVQRRILYGMKDLGSKANGPTTKSAKIVGHVMGNYHPHGDAAIYDTLVNMTQDWKARHPLTIGQGNWGSIHGHSAAAQRYTECKMSKFGEALLEDVNPNVVPFEPNYNDEMQMPTVLPAKLPNLLVNGTAGIAVGVATKIPPHNLNEVSNLISAYIEKGGNLTTDEVISIMPGPDFPTGGIIRGQKGIRDYYETGRGSVVVDGIYEIVVDDKGRQQIIITGLPYSASPSELAEKIEELVRDKKIDGIDDLKDLSHGKNGKTHIKIIVYVAKNGNANLIVNQLLKSTSLRLAFNVNNTVTVEKRIIENAPILKLVDIFVNHRKQVLTNRYNAELLDNEARMHILEGLIAVSSRIDEAIALIRASNNPAEASQTLIDNGLVTSEEQAKAVLAITLSRLTKLEADRLLQEKDELSKRNDWLRDVLGSEKKVLKIIAKETNDLAKALGNERVTTLGSSPDEITTEDLIPEEQCVISMTKDGYIKRLPLTAYRVQARGGRGVTNMSKSNEEASELFVASTHELILFFTNTGLMFKKKGYEIPEFSRTHKGIHLANLLDLNQEEKIAGFVRVKSLDADGYIVMVSRKGKIKRSFIRDYDTNLKTKGLKAIMLSDGDEVAYVDQTDGSKDVFLVTSMGKAVRYSEDNVTVTGRATQGVKAMNLSDGDNIAQLLVLSPDDNPDILVATSQGYAKRTNASQYKSTSGRNVRGVNTIDQVKFDRNGTIVSASTVSDGDTLIVLTKKGQIIQIPIDEIRSTGRNTMGVKIVKLDMSDSLTAIAKVTDGVAQAERAAEEVN
jgi:DNA gyrase subunit A